MDETRTPSAPLGGRRRAAGRRLPPAVAIVGVDGAGKTTLARTLETSAPVPVKYLYMGINTSSSNAALPTSRLADRLKARSAPRRRRLRAVARLINRTAEALYRQTLARYHRRRGYTVVYDRHFAVDFARDPAHAGPESLDRRIYRWFVTRVIAPPNFIIFLDAPAETLHARKPEGTVQELERRRRIVAAGAAALAPVIHVDATRPPADILAEVNHHLLAAHTAATGGAHDPNPNQARPGWLPPEAA